MQWIVIVKTFQNTQDSYTYETLIFSTVLQASCKHIRRYEHYQIWSNTSDLQQNNNVTKKTV
jgi:hypothetical protein